MNSPEELKHGCYEVVVIGGSWGGMDAVIRIIKNLPALFPLPVIVVIHRKKNVESGLCQLLSKNTRLKVKEITDKDAVEAGYVYLVPSNYHVLIEKERVFSLDVSEDVRFSRPSIDILFESAAQVYREKLIAILLTGANSDGSDGMKLVAEKGGLTIVQDPKEALSMTMPLSAIGKVKVDYILNLDQIHRLLLNIVSKR